jgi:hypothetical protein
VIYYENKKDIVKKHTIECRQKLNPVVTRRKNIKDTDCEGMFLYEEEPDGDGLKGKYWDNEGWVGSSTERIDDNINFVWTGASPKKGINKHNFSVKWEGFLSAPLMGYYTFAIECDDAATLAINGDLIIDHNTQTTHKESSSRTESWLEHEIYKKSNPSKNHKKTFSNKVYLVGGNKYQ